MSDRRKRHDATDRPRLEEPEVRRLVGEIAPGAEAVDLGGTMSLNVGLQPAGLVLRVHRPQESRRRLLALQEVRRRLAERGLVVGAPVPWRGRMLFRCGGRWAELERYVPNEMPERTPEAYRWMFGAMGALHRELARLEVVAPRPAVSTYGPPSTLLRWLPRTEAAVKDDPEARETARRVRALVERLRSRWIPQTALPLQLVHGDIRIGNVRRSPDGAQDRAPVYFDFGFLARRPRIHELAYSLSWMVLRPDGRGTPEAFPWETVPELVGIYEEAAQVRLTSLEWRALAPYTAAVPLYLACVAAFVSDPVAHLKHETRLAFLRIGEWLLENPGAVSHSLTANG